MSKTTGKALYLALFLLAGTIFPFAAGAGQPGPQAIPADMSCGVCGMFPARFVKWQTQVIFSDGSMVPFDGAKDMFKYILEMAKYDESHTDSDIAAIWVKDYGRGEWLDGREASYVVGSREMGPMGKELIPFGSTAAAKDFQAANGGELRKFTDITLAEVKKLGMGGMKMKGMKMGM